MKRDLLTKLIIGGVFLNTIILPITAESKNFDAVAVYKSKCAGCHGAKGEGKSIFPKIAGQSQAELSRKLNGYKNNSYGKARKTMMRPNVQNLSTQEITQIAEVVAKF